jgi:uncharacterized protein
MGDDNFLRMEKLMSQDTMQAVIDSVHELTLYQNRPFSVVMHGGEPLLFGKTRLDYFFKRLRGVLPEIYPISIQTNGILINKEILDICSMYRVSIAVSMDGPKEIHDRKRVNHLGKGTFDEVMKGYELLKNHPDATFLNAGLLAVVDPESDAEQVYNFFKSTGAPSVDFLFKDGNHSSLPEGKKTFDSVEYGTWTSKLLANYLEDSNPMPIRVLDDMMKVFLGGMVTKEGIGLSDFGILIIDTDGSLMKNDTLKSVYNGADRFDENYNIKDRKLMEFLQSSTFRRYKVSQRPTSTKCMQCNYLKLCGGGMLLHRWKNESGFDNPSVYCKDMKFLINNMHMQLKKHLAHELEYTLDRFVEG